MASVSIANLESEERAALYSFMARVLSSRPTMDTVWGVCQMAAALGLQYTDGHSLDELDSEFTDLFVVPNPRYVAPYESVFCPRQATLARTGAESVSPELPACGPAEDLQDIYREAGLTPGKEVPDHIGSELRFMAYLWLRQSKAPEADASRLTEMREKFRQNHLLGWVGRLREKVSESDRLGYYQTAFRVTEAIIQGDV